MAINISSTHAFERDYPAATTIQSVHEEQLMLRAVEAYRFFYPTVSCEAIFDGSRRLGIEDSKQIMTLAAGPRHVVFTANSDTPYASAVLDLAAAGPIVVDLPPGPFIGLAMDHHQRWIADMGLPGPDAGKGGKHLILQPTYSGKLPDGYHVSRSATLKASLALRAMPKGHDTAAALAALRQIKVYPLARPETPLAFIDATERSFDTTPLRWEDNLEYWKRLHAVIDLEPVPEEYRPMYGALAALGIVKGKPFAPDARIAGVLEAAAKAALDEMRVEAFASDRPERMVWPDRRWEWITLVPEDANFEHRHFLDLQARDRWFFQAICASPAMFRRQVGSGSLYWLAARDQGGGFLDGDQHYKLVVPQPVPASLFWSVTAYDAKTRSQVVTPQGKAVLGSLKDKLSGNGVSELYLGPSAPKGKEAQWIQTPAGRGFFLYFRIYGPTTAALDASWKLGDVMRV